MPTLILSDRQARWYFMQGVDEEYSLTAQPSLAHPDRLWKEWLTEHDRRVAHAAWAQGHADGTYDGRNDATADEELPNPYDKPTFEDIQDCAD